MRPDRRADALFTWTRRRVHAALLATGLPGAAGAVFAAPAPAAVAAGAEGPPTGRWTHAYGAYGPPLYPAGFSHFGYVNPQAPKGGTLYCSNPDRRSSFDKFNYFTLKGNAPAGLMHFMFEPLAVLGADEPLTMYGLLAEAIFVAPDRSSIAFRLNTAARFYDGSPVLAEDVKYSFDCLAGPGASPSWQSSLAGVSRAVVVGEREIRFELKERSNALLFKLGTSLQVFSRRWALQTSGPQAGQPKPFDQIVHEVPLTSGPYFLHSHEGGRRIEFRRNPAYWARELPVRRGFFNFDRVVYRLYQDEDVQVEAFKAGEFDILRAYSARVFMRQHKGPKWTDGRIVKAQLASETVNGLQSYQLNLRRPVFQDRRVRQALGLAWNFELTNRYGLFKQADSVFNNSDFGAQGLPGPGELALLEPFRAQLPPEVFGPPYRAPRFNDAPGALRRNLLQARALLKDAGWRLDADGWLRNAAGQPLEFEYLSPGENTAREEEWAADLRKLGVRLKLRKVDFALFARRLDEVDFDCTTIVEGYFTVPPASDYFALYSSTTADQKGNANYRGVKHPAVDRALKAMADAETLPALRDACRALDRIVMWQHWQVPQLYAPFITLSHWNKFGKPARAPRCFTVSVTTDIEPQLAWPELCWWHQPGGQPGGQPLPPAASPRT